MKRAKIARNTHTAPPGSKIVLLSQVFKQTLAKTSDKLTGANIKIHRCSEAFIYLLSPLRYRRLLLLQLMLWRSSRFFISPSDQ